MSARSSATINQRDSALEARLEKTLEGARIGRPVYAFQHLGSTMDVARALAAEQAPEGTLVVAVRQDRGRGRLGRIWESPPGGLYCSLILRPTRPREDVPQLSLVAGLCVAETIHALTMLSPTIRWPNDVLLNNKKVAGILAEGSRLKAEPAVILGIGMNVTTPLRQLPDTATSLAAEGAKPETDQLLGALCRRLQVWYDVWRTEGLAPIREALRPWMGLFGQMVHIAAGNIRYEGVATDLDESGKLLVRLDSGILRPFEMGEVTLLR